ncbi:hypothetical protein AAMO2058_000372900 [Amorphochlora amoebiformis]
MLTRCRLRMRTRCMGRSPVPLLSVTAALILVFSVSPKRSLRRINPHLPHHAELSRRSVVSLRELSLRGGQKSTNESGTTIGEKRAAPTQEGEPKRTKPFVDFKSNITFSWGKAPAVNFSWMGPLSNTSSNNGSGVSIGALFGSKSKAEEEKKNDIYDSDFEADEQVLNSTSGEANETHLWRDVAGLFALEKEQWHSKGRGPARVNLGTDHARVILRAERINKLLLNIPINKDLVMMKHSNGKGALFRSVNFLPDQPTNSSNMTAETFAIRFKDKDTTEQFLAAVERAKSAVLK